MQAMQLARRPYGTCIYAARARARAGAPIATCILMHDELTPDNHATAFFVKNPACQRSGAFPHAY